MLTEQQIQQALHASRIVPLSMANPHGPLGLEQLAVAVALITDSPVPLPEKGRLRRPIALSMQAWQKLQQLAETTAQATARPVNASDVATAIIEQFVASTTPLPDGR
jgi:hypothetical protein